mgnify:CR=1 FL=1
MQITLTLDTNDQVDLISAQNLLMSLEKTLSDIHGVGTVEEIAERVAGKDQIHDHLGRVQQYCYRNQNLR